MPLTVPLQEVLVRPVVAALPLQWAEQQSPEGALPLQTNPPERLQLSSQLVPRVYARWKMSKQWSPPMRTLCTILYRGH